ncbi:MAG: MMPL family transporter [Planctomycetota bacterium]|nr:MMPL family transporter [Planctomycetota bacterium]
MLILCMACFLLPFALRGARMAATSMQNNVADWLPSNYEETQELREFRKYFFGDQFVVISGPWCREGDQVYTNLVRKLREESLEYEPTLRDSKQIEELRAHRKGDDLGLIYTGNYHETWGEQREKWLLGRKGQWYWVNRKGELWRWDGQNNVIQGAKRSMERSLKGRNQVTGTYIDTFGEPPDDQKGIENPFYKDPQKLCARPFKSVTTGPEIFEKMAGPNGTIRIGMFGEGDETTFQAKVEAHNRLTGALFGPTPKETFKWTFESLLQHVDDPSKLQILRSTNQYRDLFEKFIEVEVAQRYEGDFDRLLNASPSDKLEIWYRLWEEALELDAPARQTCIIVTLNEPVLEEMDRAVGRPILGKPRGRVLELATGECGIDPKNVHLGGPPRDNVAIDEEGASTLLRLVSLSLIIGLGLAYACFRSIPVTMMLFFVGGVAAISSLSYVWFAGSTLDAILMSMPSLVYVLGLSGAVHIVNYYRDACHESGPKLAAEIAVKHGWFPCTLAAFTTGLGLVSLCTSNLTPIQKFGFFSAIATMATVALLFTFLPAALTIWPPGYKKEDRSKKTERRGLAAYVKLFWQRVGDWVVQHYAVVAIVSLLVMGYFAYGITKVQTSVHLLKLFDSDSKILQDYRWMESNLGKLVPMELVVCIDEDSQKEAWLDKEREKAKAKRKAELLAAGQPVPENDEDFDFEYDQLAYDLKYSVLERMELSARVRTQLERFFGPDGLDYVGPGMATDVFAPMHLVDTQVDPGFDNAIETLNNPRYRFNAQLQTKYPEILEEDYLAVAGKSNLDYLEAMADKSDPEIFGREMWRVSLRLAALNDVDYGKFVADIKSVVEPIMTAYRQRTHILESIQKEKGDASLKEGMILVFGRNPDNVSEKMDPRVDRTKDISELVDQTFIFSDTLQDLLENRGYVNKDTRAGKKSPKSYRWIDPDDFGEGKKTFPTDEALKKFIELDECHGVVVIEDDDLFDVDFIKQNAGTKFVDCRDHEFKVDPVTKKALPNQFTAMQGKKQGEFETDVATIYTGIIPIVYKAQNQLLRSLVNSIALAFVMIAGVMMLLLRNWRRPVSMHNLLNIRGGALSMLPNIFPVLIVFGALGHLGRKVDIGSMMTASVAMGVAVDDTIHFLNWYRKGLAQGLRRVGAIRLAYDRVATAMTQTTLIGGLGLSAFALSTFTPTQAFGVLMLFLLVAALVGDLIFLPALLASPLGKYFGRELPLEEVEAMRAAEAMEEASVCDEEELPAGDVSIRVVPQPDGDAPSESSSSQVQYDVHPDSFLHSRKEKPGSGESSAG